MSRNVHGAWSPVVFQKSSIMCISLALVPQLLLLVSCWLQPASSNEHLVSGSDAFVGGARHAIRSFSNTASNNIQCTPQAPRTDCGYFGIQQPECESRGCCWSPVAVAAAAEEGRNTEPDGSAAFATVAGGGGAGGGGTAAATAAATAGTAASAAQGSQNDLPWCFFPNAQEQEPVYEVESIQPSGPGGAITTLMLRLRQEGDAAATATTAVSSRRMQRPDDVNQHRHQHQHDQADSLYQHQQKQQRQHFRHQRQQHHQGSDLGADCERLEVRLEQQAAHRLYIRVQPAGQEAPGAAAAAAGEGEGEPEESAERGKAGLLEARWRVPEELLPRPPSPSKPPAAPLYQLHLPTAGADFSLKVARAKILTGTTETKSAGLNGYGGNGARGRGTADASVGAQDDDVNGNESSDQILLDLSGRGCLVFKPQFLQLRAQVPTDINLYGMGETTQAGGLKLPRDGSYRALWNSDTPASAVGVNLYGSHPVLYGIAPGGTSFGWFLANSNAMDFAAGAGGDVTFRMVGGILELWVFCGPGPEQVTAQYQEVVGRPAMPPRWALGFHQSRYGYGSVDELEDVVASYNQARIPLDVVWSDIDYTDRARMFTVDPEHYPQQRLRALVDSLHASGRRWVPILDCGITALPGAGYEPYERGLSYDVFIKDSGGQPLVGQVWSGPTHWPDFMHPNATPYWTSLMAEMYDKLPYDGIWLDMNEPSNFCTGECELPARRSPSAAAAAAATEVGAAAAVAAAAAASGRPAGPLGIACVLQCRQPGPDDALSNPPYRVNNGNRHAPLYGNTLPMTAVGYGGVRQYDAHNLYALAESRVTHAALRSVNPGARPFILTRSSWAGQGRYSAHWTGDNTASWDDLRRSPGGLMAASLAGMALAGADVCGFMGATNEQLCARWLAAGAFYTFARDHSDRGSPPQEPYRWPLVAEAARNALGARYSLLPYLYTAFYLAHTRGGTVARPLVWAVPGDPRVTDLSSQWLLGDALMVAPVLAPDMDTVNVYFSGPGPADLSSEYPDHGTPGSSGGRSKAFNSSSSSSIWSGTSSSGVGGSSISSGTWCRYSDLSDCYTGPSWRQVKSPLGAAPPLFLRAGSIVPTQPLASPTAPTAITTSSVAASPLTLLVLLSAAGSSAQGHPPATRSGFGSGSMDVAAAERRDIRDDLVANGFLYADNGTAPDVGGSGSLRVRMAAGASLAAGSGWMEFHVEAATTPPQPWRVPKPRHGLGAVDGFGSTGDEMLAAAEGPAGADVDVRQLRVWGVVVVGVALPPGSVGLEVEVEVEGLAPVRLEDGVRLDLAGHLLRLEGLNVSAVKSFRLAWKPKAAVSAPVTSSVM